MQYVLYMDVMLVQSLRIITSDIQYIYISIWLNSDKTMATVHSQQKHNAFCKRGLQWMVPATYEVSPLGINLCLLITIVEFNVEKIYVFTKWKRTYIILWVEGNSMKFFISFLWNKRKINTRQSERLFSVLSSAKSLNLYYISPTQFLLLLSFI